MNFALMNGKWISVSKGGLSEGIPVVVSPILFSRRGVELRN